MLKAEEWDPIVALLVRAVAANASPRATLCAFVGNEFAEHLSVDLSAPREVVLAALRICIADGYQHKPAWLVSLLQPIAYSEPVPGILMRLSNPPPPAVDPLTALLLTTDVPFVDRNGLRDALRVLQSASGMKRVLVVSGPHYSGKSYSRELIEHLCGATGNLVHCHAPLLPGQEAITGARELARDMVAQMGRSLATIPNPDTNQDRWVRELAIWILSEAVSTTYDWWLVFDGFDHPDLRPDARKLIVNLADQVNNGVFARRCRLILLGFDRTGLAAPPWKILSEELNPDLDGEVAACVAAILARTGSQADAQRVTTSLLQDLPSGVERLPALNRKLTDLFDVAGDA